MKIKTIRLLLQSSLLLVLCLLFIASYSQQKETTVKKVYIHGGVGASTYNGFVGEFGAQAIFKHNWVATISYQTIEMDAKNLPSNYTPEVSLIGALLPFVSTIPVSTLSVINFTGGKCFEASRRIWFTTEAGLSVVSGEKLSFAPQTVVNDVFFKSSNYSVKKEDVSTVGVVLKADFNWAFCPFLGLGAGVFANFNSIQSPIGYQVKLIGGWMHLKPKVKKSKL